MRQVPVTPFVRCTALPFPIPDKQVLEMGYIDFLLVNGSLRFHYALVTRFCVSTWYTSPSASRSETYVEYRLSQNWTRHLKKYSISVWLHWFFNQIAIPTYTVLRRIDSFSKSAASCNGFSALCTYNFDVMALEECPRALLITSMPTPWPYISVAAVCRASWSRLCLIPQRRRQRFQAL